MPLGPEEVIRCSYTTWPARRDREEERDEEERSGGRDPPVRVLS